jgi:rubrerythrin
MATTIGNEDSLPELLANLIKLDYDAIEAYDAAIERVEDPTYKDALAEFRDDHVTHTNNLSELLLSLGETPPEGADAKSILTEGKVKLATLGGDKAILRAMLSNEGDTNTAYERATVNQAATPEVLEILELNYADEQNHKRWLEGAIDTDF